MPVDVSVVIPFFNPGANVEDCIDSVLAQTLAPDRYQVVLVDDGSTDGSLARVQARVSRHPALLSVHHIPASGGPGRPRNVGIDASTGRYVQFLDSDDTLAPQALERLLEVADSSDADVVVGKLSSDFRGIHQPLFRRTVTRRTLENFPLMLNLTVCKMFRREFLTEFGIRFPEGRHYIEDQHFCVESYVHARSVAIVGDTACYFYRRRRTGGGNFGDSTIVPADYYRELAMILDLLETEVTASETKLEAQSRFYRNEMLGRLRGPAMQSYDDDYRRELVAEVRGLATTTIAPGVHERLPVFLRTQSRLLLDDDLNGLLDYGRHLDAIRLRATTTTPSWLDGRLIVEVAAAFRSHGKPIRLERDSDGWLLPEWMAPGVGADDRRFRADEEIDLDLATISQADAELWSTTEGLALEITDDGRLRVRGRVSLDPGTVRGGSALTAGRWNLRLRVIVGGLSRVSVLRPAADTPPTATAWVESNGTGGGSVSAVWTGSPESLTLDVDEWSQSLHDLFADQLEDTPRIEDQRRLVISSAALHGPLHGASGAARAARIVLEPLESAELGVVDCEAELRVGPDGATIAAAIPDLPAAAPRWAVWLRIGEIGGAPPRRLPLELAEVQVRSGGSTVRVTTTQD